MAKRKDISTPISDAECAEISGIPENRIGELKKYGAVKNTKSEWDKESVYIAALKYWRDELDYILPEELGVFYGVTRTRIVGLTPSVFKQESDGRYPRKENLYIAGQKLRERIEGGKEDIASIKKERAQLELDILKKQNRELDESYLPRADVEKAWENVVLLTRGKFLTIANKCAPRVVLSGTDADAEKIIQEEIDEALSELSRPPNYGGTVEEAETE